MPSSSNDDDDDRSSSSSTLVAPEGYNEHVLQQLEDITVVLQQ
jgi:hypothetical protein